MLLYDSFVFVISSFNGPAAMLQLASEMVSQWVDAGVVDVVYIQNGHIYLANENHFGNPIFL